MLDAPPLLTLSDPVGDVRGDGSYTLPSALVGGIERSLDVRELRADNVGGKLVLTVGLGGTDNPWNAPRGFSAILLDVFVKTDYGGQLALGDTGFSAPPGSGWQRHYQVSGFATRAWAADKDGTVRPLGKVPDVRLEGSALILATDLAAGSDSYWVTSRIYSPLTPKGFLEPQVDAGEAGLGAPRPGMPSPVDVLASGDQARLYAERVVPPSGQRRDRRPLILLGVAVGALLLTLVATVRAWRRP